MEQRHGAPLAEFSITICKLSFIITMNTNTTLEFPIPRTLETGTSYFIAVRTQIRGTTKLKTAITGYSKVP